ncbi:MAG: NrfD/PsrC family molybdoenzyme membrane anchor subunit [Candidatus Glassbacteria bacterium]
MRTLERPGRSYFILLSACTLLALVGVFSWYHQIREGIGVAGLNNPVKWGVYITNFVFWVGIAHSGTLISAILFLFRVRWRNTVFRSAEMMTVIAVMTAGLFPLIHLGRPWFFYWLLPYPNQMQLWPNFQSPLIWDVFAVGTYFIVSSIFLFLGLVPDLAAVRDRVAGLRRRLYSLLSLGWMGTNRQWRHYRSAYGFFAAFATPLVVSVHSVVSWDFAMSIVPGWHSTIFAPYFVAGAIHSGLAMVITILIPMRKYMDLESYITTDHLENLAKLIVLTGLIVGYSYVSEFFVAWYSENPFEQAIFSYRVWGDYALLFWFMLIFNSLLPLLFLIKGMRRGTVSLMVISILINVGMYLERLVIIVSSLAHEYEPYAWGTYKPSIFEIGITVGSLGWFLMWFLILIKLLPAVSIAEVKEILPIPGREESS